MRLLESPSALFLFCGPVVICIWLSIYDQLTQQVSMQTRSPRGGGR